MTLNKPIVGMASTPDGKGYWLVASDGGVFNFGDASFDGSLGHTSLGAPVIGMWRGATSGYGLATSDGGFYGFGGEQFLGAASSLVLRYPIVGGSATP
jgi:hypothetical protein